MQKQNTLSPHLLGEFIKFFNVVAQINTGKALFCGCRLISRLRRFFVHAATYHSPAKTIGITTNATKGHAILNVLNERIETLMFFG